jgi:hypothetical protein
MIHEMAKGNDGVLSDSCILEQLADLQILPPDIRAQRSDLAETKSFENSVRAFGCPILPYFRK